MIGNGSRGHMKAIAAAIILAASIAVHAAYAQDDSSNVLSEADTNRLTALAKQKMATEKTLIASMSNEAVAKALTENLNDKTKIIFQQGYGVYVEYTAADGGARMWFPGNKSVVVGHWGVQMIDGHPRACFKYFNGYDVVTKEFEPTECINSAQTLSNGDVISQRPGDIFHLLTGHIPYPKGLLNLPAWPR